MFGSDFGVCVPFPFGVLGMNWNSIASVPDRYLFIYYIVFLCCLVFIGLLIVTCSSSFPFGVLGMMWNSIASVPDRYLFIYFIVFLCCLFFIKLLIVTCSSSFPFSVLGMMWNSIVSVPDRYLFIFSIVFLCCLFFLNCKKLVKIKKNDNKHDLIHFVTTGQNKNIRFDR